VVRDMVRDTVSRFGPDASGRAPRYGLTLGARCSDRVDAEPADEALSAGITR
jgi:hypothetical protein